MLRRRFLTSMAGVLAAPASFSVIAQQNADTSAESFANSASLTRIGAAWRGASADSTQHVGVLEVDWPGRRVTIRAAQPVPGRAHGLLAEADATWIAMAYRFGRWLWRLDAEGRPMRTLDLGAEGDTRCFAGHVIRSPDGGALLTTEMDPRTGEGFIGVRDPASLRKLDEWRTHGSDPHQLLIDPHGNVVVANGGVLRTPQDRKRDLDRMASSLVVLDGRLGALRGQWCLDDPRLSLRHLAYSRLAPDRPPCLGIALQAEHDDPSRRAEAPVLALFDGRDLTIPSMAADGGGYAGDIAPAPGGFVVSCQFTGRALWWRADAPARYETIAKLTQACALGAGALPPSSIVIAGALGVGRWHPSAPAALLPWPQPMALDNHWIVLDAA